MDGNSISTRASEVAIDLSPTIIIYEDGKVERLKGNDTVPASFDPKTNVDSKDVFYCPVNNLSARLYIRRNQNRNDKKIPLLVYFHGGGFCIETAFSPHYHNHLNALVSEADVVAVSVDYRRAPEHPLPAAYDDSWEALKWVASHVNGNGPEDWLNRYADFAWVFFAGDSAGANIAHHMGIRHGGETLDGVNLAGIVLIHPYFLGNGFVGAESADRQKKALLEKIWRLASPGSTSGCDDPWINPAGSDELPSLGCDRVLVFVAEKDFLKDRGWLYYEKLKESGWRGHVEIAESKGEKAHAQHVFHLSNPSCENAVAMLKRIASFFNHSSG